MSDAAPEPLDPRLERLGASCLELPEAKREVSGRHASFRVRGRTFAYFLDDHHGDGIVGLNAKAAPGSSEARIEDAPDRFYRPAYLGHRGWVGLRLDTAGVDWDEVAGVVVESYRLCAPKSLARAIDAGWGRRRPHGWRRARSRNPTVRRW